ncbi:GlxA family transcriptional regulator [Nocardiopsis rhodophaea]|uniref:GlxA family transcriptional regulator n=1 Tax=Nocardiopsis rhodophaea TaxID=280238 RepID=A0ABN2TH86_9ACTN
MRRVVFLLMPGVHLLDLAGPAQVFSTADEVGHAYAMDYVAERADVPTAQGVTLRASTTWPGLGPADLVLVPGWKWHGPAEPPAWVSADQARRLAAHHAAGGAVASVCAGAFALGTAGLLDGRRCTTHHELQDRLDARFPNASVVRDVLYVTDGRVATSAGIASGIDLALHLVATDHGPAAAAQVARNMVVYARRNGHDQQVSAMLRYRSHMSDTAHRAQDIIDARYTATLRLGDLASACGVSERTLTRRFTDATGTTPLRYQHMLRVERAEHLIAHGATVDSAARAVGFQDPRMLRRLRARRAAPAS